MGCLWIDLEYLVVVVMGVIRIPSGGAFGKGGSTSMRMLLLPWFGPGWIGMISVRLLT